MLKVKQFVFNSFGVNTYIIYDSDTHEAIVVDPGMNSDAEHRRFDEFIDEQKLKITQVVNTHLHIDHCIGDNYVADKYGIKIAAHPDDTFLGQNIEAQARMFGLSAMNTSPVIINVNLADGDIIKLGSHEIKVIHVPGHSPGGIALYCADSNILISGDALFHGSIGRTDLPGGEHNTLLTSIKEKLLTLPDSSLVLPGHDMSTTIAKEKSGNPFL